MVKLKKLEPALQKLADIIDVGRLKEAEKLQEAVWQFGEVPRLPVIINYPVGEEWPLYPYTEAFHDPEKILWNELAWVYAGAKLKDDRMFTVRANYGVGVIPSIFRCNVMVTHDNLPWVEPLRAIDKVRELVDRGRPQIEQGLGLKVLEGEQFFKEIFSNNAKLREAIHIYLCDTQGPFDVTHLIWGPDIYYAVYDQPDLVHKVLDLVTEVIIEFSLRQKDIIGENYRQGYHGGYKIRGGIRVVDDSSVNLSREMYKEFSQPYNERILKEFGGYVHYCGGGVQWLDNLINTKGLYGIELGFGNAGKTDDYDLFKIYEKIYPKKICLLWHDPVPAETIQRITTGLILVPPNTARTFEEAKRIGDSVS